VSENPYGKEGKKGSVARRMGAGKPVKSSRAGRKREVQKIPKKKGVGEQKWDARCFPLGKNFPEKHGGGEQKRRKENNVLAEH